MSTFVKTLLPCLLVATAFTVLAQEDALDTIEPVMELPKEYSDYLVAPSTISPDKRFAVIIPKVSLCAGDDSNASPTPTPSTNRCRDYVAYLDPFAILGELETKYPEFENKSNGGISAEWRKDGSAVLITLESKWGPGDIFLVELSNGKMTRTTNLLQKAHELLQADYKKSKAAPYNDAVDYIFLTESDGGIAEFIDATHVRIGGNATSDPKAASAGEKAWHARVEAMWDIPSGKFTSQKVIGKSSGKKKAKKSDG